TIRRVPPYNAFVPPPLATPRAGRRETVAPGCPRLRRSQQRHWPEYSMTFTIRLTLNGERRNVELDDPRVTLLDLLRERLDLTGTKKGCDRGQCGACTVLVDGRRINACLSLAVSLDGAEVLTIEGLAEGARLHPVQAAFIAHDGF